MDILAKELQSFLVLLGMQPDAVSPQTAHFIEHLLHLLEVDDEETVIHYYGLFGVARESLYDLANEHGLSPEQMLERIDTCIHRLSVTPEWQMIKQTINNR